MMQTTLVMPHRPHAVRRDERVEQWCMQQHALLEGLERALGAPGATPGPTPAWCSMGNHADRMRIATEIVGPLLLIVEVVAFAVCEDDAATAIGRWAARMVAGRAERMADHMALTLGVRRPEW